MCKSKADTTQWPGRLKFDVALIFSCAVDFFLLVRLKLANYAGNGKYQLKSQRLSQIRSQGIYCNLINSKKPTEYLILTLFLLAPTIVHCPILIKKEAT